MREKQRIADLKKQGIEPFATEEGPKKKEYDTSFMAKYEVVEDEETKDDSGKQPQLYVEEETKESKPLSAKKKLIMSQPAAMEAKSDPALGGQKQK
jgi:hypothetical protein